MMNKRLNLTAAQLMERAINLPAPVKVKAPGTVNGYVGMYMKLGNTKLGFDGTTLGMVRTALEHGAKVGSVVHSEMGRYRLVAAPHDDRANGVWAERIWGPKGKGQ